MFLIENSVWCPGTLVYSERRKQRLVPGYFNLIIYSSEKEKKKKAFGVRVLAPSFIYSFSE
jgi:hypothetical protein